METFSKKEIELLKKIAFNATENGVDIWGPLPIDEGEMNVLVRKLDSTFRPTIQRMYDKIQKKRELLSKD